MLKFNNNHIFTGFLKQKLSSVNIPLCKIYTKEFADYYQLHGKEDPRIIESVDNVAYSSDDVRVASRVNYLKNNEIYNYFWNYSDKKADLGYNNAFWKKASNIYFDQDKSIPGLTKTLYSPGSLYDKVTHEYLGEYLRFLRDYHNVNLMSLYNCFNNSICSNISTSFYYKNKKVVFDYQDTKYKIYAIPVKLFANYTIAIDSYQGVELFCGFYNTRLEDSDKSKEFLFAKTYQKIDRAIFNQPFLFDSLDFKYWSHEHELTVTTVQEGQTSRKKVKLNNNIVSRWDIINRERDLKLFIKVPVSCKSSIVILEGDFRGFNNVKYAPITDPNSEAFGNWKYQQNHTVLNFNSSELNYADFTPINKSQLLEFNTGESYPFADRLIEYLVGSTITPIDEIADNIKRAQRVMKQNQHYFRIEGLWEHKMQKIIYDYIVNTGPIELSEDKKSLIDKRSGYIHKLGHRNKSTLYDTLGYIDRDAEKLYASWKKTANSAEVRDTIQNIDIYDGLYDL